MGMEIVIYSAKNHEVFKHDGWWDNPNVQEEFYACKFYELIQNCSFISSDYQGEWTEINEDHIEEMIKIACQHRDYFGTYDNVARLCELRDRYNTLKEQGYHLYFNCSY